jgi:hypothetical protein
MLWKFLSDDVDRNFSSQEIEADKNIWQALEIFSLHNEETLIAKNNSQAKKINYTLLMTAFSDYKKTN